MGGKAIPRIPTQLTSKAKVDSASQRVVLPNFQGGLQILKEWGYFCHKEYSANNTLLSSIATAKASSLWRTGIWNCTWLEGLPLFLFLFTLGIVCLWYILYCSVVITMPNDIYEQVRRVSCMTAYLWYQIEQKIDEGKILFLNLRATEHRIRVKI